MRKYIINIIGPTAVGKTTVIKELLDYLPQYEVLAIDDFRRKYDSSTAFGEFKAWSALAQRIHECPYIIMETSGTSQNLAQVLRELHANYHVVMFTVRLDAPHLTRQLRKVERLNDGYTEPPMYFHPIYDDTRDVVVATNVVIHTTKSPLECAGQIMDRLPDTMV